MAENPLYVLGVLCALIALSEFLCRYTFLKHLSSSLLVIILGALFANFGIIPTASNAGELYAIIFTYVAPASIFFLLLGVNLRKIKEAGMPMLLAFFIGALGTMIGVLVALQLIDYKTVFGVNYQAVAGMMTGTYVGGSANFNALAIHYGMLREGAEYTGLVVADNIVTAIWMLVTLSLPVIMKKIKPHPESIPTTKKAVVSKKQKKTDPLQLSFLLALAIFTLIVSDTLAGWSESLGLGIPSILILTTIALIFAQFRYFQKLEGANLLGMFSIYLFLVVVGAFCEIGALQSVGEKAPDILIFTSTIVLVHGAFLFLIALIFKFDWVVVAIASQANIGGASTALALSKTFNRSDLLLPAILVGSLGTGLGTYVGFLVAGMLS
ncbi:hypothetical protein C7S20_12445 [Christiangramia fulva]|uniref:DUF819 domain-containing protein n=1 Tax=Christiangramia fulva TaxID=2126553 RepID=A0A2R3Z6Y7_9FLAO|nr:DUF819 family protein [Christiangramia fulva]AVR45998.1 hypothetical protein C7S20_12445 [Christiangramia fulva]